MNDTSSTANQPGLLLIHSNRLEALRDLLLAWMDRHPLEPLENEVFLVQSNGMAQWLKMAIAGERGDPQIPQGSGIAAGLSFSLPSRFLWQVYRAVLGPLDVPESSPFDKPELLWRLMKLLPQLLEHPLYQPIRHFLSDDTDLRKRYQLAERLADLFDQYQVYRSDWLEAWGRGSDHLITHQGHEKTLPQGLLWQPSLWRSLLLDVAKQPVTESRKPPEDALSRASVHHRFLKKAGSLGHDEWPKGLPRRLMIFGLSSLPRQSLEVLQVLSKWTQIFVSIQNPSEHYWSDIVADRDLLNPRRYQRQSRKANTPEILSEELLHLHAHPLLAAWGRQGRDFIALLDELDDPLLRMQYEPLLKSLDRRIDCFESPGTKTILQQLQDDIRDLRPLSETKRLWPTCDPRQDHSIRFHVAHGPLREVEILHDQLLALLNGASDLRPRDIMVMVPDIEAFAPHIKAVFGLHDTGSERYIPFAIADQHRKTIDPFMQAVENLLSLPNARLGVSEVLDLLDVAALRQRFSIQPSDIPLYHRWINSAHIRWGLNGTHRRALGLVCEDAVGQNTWLFGCRRLLLGYATGAAVDEWQGIIPSDDIGGLEASALGPLIELLDHLETAWHVLSEIRTPDEWAQTLRALLEDFFDPTGTEDGLTVLEMERQLEDWRQTCEQSEYREPLPLSIVKDHWLLALGSQGVSQGYLAGAVTFATLMPMRAIPFEVVCLLGMNDGDYPRPRNAIDFDLMAHDVRPGDRSRREDDRYLFLEALLAARRNLYISWVGHSINDHTERPPSVLVGQLRDHIEAGWSLADDVVPLKTNLIGALTIVHPLQPFSPRYFRGLGTPSGLFSYAHEWVPSDVVEPLDNGSSAGCPIDDRLPPPVPDEPLTLRALTAFLKNPAKAFFQTALGTFFHEDESPSEDVEPFTLSHLDRWSLQDALIQHQRVLIDAAKSDDITTQSCDHMASLNNNATAFMRRFQLKGALVSDGFGDLALEELLISHQDLLHSWAAIVLKWPNEKSDQALSLHHEITLNGQLIRLHDTVQGIRFNDQGASLHLVLEASDLKKEGRYRKDVIARHWVTHLALNLEGRNIRTQILSKMDSMVLEPLPSDEAAHHLDQLLVAWFEGMQYPLPLALKTGFCWLDEHHHEKAQKVYDGDTNHPGEGALNPYLSRAFPNFKALLRSGAFERWVDPLLGPIHSMILHQEARGPRRG